MDETLNTTPCKECTGSEEVLLRAEIDHLKQHIEDRDAHILTLETEIEKSHSQASDLHIQLDTWQEKYERLYDSHKRVQTLNQVLEDKLLQMVDRMKNEKTQLTKDIATVSVRLAESKHSYTMLHKENERYKNDMNLAIQLLQCKPDNFVSHKLDNLPLDTQARVSQYVMSKTKPTTSNSSLTKNGNEIDSFDASEYEFNISASLVSKILEDSIQDTVTKHCDTCTCSKTQNKPFCYNDSHYSIATQTMLSGEMKNSLCLNCNADVKSLSHLSTRSGSPHAVRLDNEKNPAMPIPGPLYVIPQPTDNLPRVTHESETLKVKPNPVIDVRTEEKLKFQGAVQKDVISKIGEDLKQIRKSNGMSMEPAVHHKLCDRTKTPISSKKSSNSLINEDVLVKDLSVSGDTKVENQLIDNISLRKNSHSSMDAVSRTSSIAKSTCSTHKSNTQVGPGPRFCSLRMQAGSKNILLDNAQPDVPPVLYRRQSKCTENTIFKELTEGIDTFLDIDRNNEVPDNFFKNDNNIVVESTLVDVHVENNTKESNISVKHPINPVLMNVSSSPLQPLKTHTFSNNSEQNNNLGQSVGSQKNMSEVDNLLNDFNLVNNNVSDTKYNDNESNITLNKPDELSPSDNRDIKIFNFDRYEQNKLPSQYARPLRKIDMAHLHSLENTKISKDFPPQGDLPKIPRKDIGPKSNNSNVINVYPNLTQTHLKVSDKKKVFTNEQSTSSLSSDDSAAILQKQQLLRVAEWVEQNLEQQNNFNDPLADEDSSFTAKIARRESRLNRLTDTLNELALNMPHPVSKYSKKVLKDDQKNCNHNNHETQTHQHVSNRSAISRVNYVAKETIFPVEDQTQDTPNDIKEFADDITKMKNLNDVLNGEKEITADDLARMEYNVKKFLLSGPQWANTESVGRSRRTSSKTETDV